MAIELHVPHTYSKKAIKLCRVHMMLYIVGCHLALVSAFFADNLRPAVPPESGIFS